MKLMIASDIHGSAKHCRELLEAYRREAPDRLLLLAICFTTDRATICPRATRPKR